jgi:hypothetical protein
MRKPDDPHAAARFAAVHQAHLLNSKVQLTMEERARIAEVLEVLAEKIDELFAIMEAPPPYNQPEVIQTIENVFGKMSQQQIAPGITAYTLPPKPDTQ